MATTVYERETSFADIMLACEQALIFVVIKDVALKDVARAAKPRVTSFITTKMRVCSQANIMYTDSET